MDSKPAFNDAVWQLTTDVIVDACPDHTSLPALRATLRELSSSASACLRALRAQLEVEEQPISELQVELAERIRDAASQLAAPSHAEALRTIHARGLAA